MTDWTSGYVADVGYTFGYYGELNPLRVRLAFLNSGLVFPEVVHACELGFGQGVSANLHAAASTVQWYGTDFNPSQAGFAQELAKAANSGAKLYDESFSEFCNRPDLPEFDYIGLHGIWSWISDENRNTIVDFLQRKLKVGGVLYVSYNTLPGWSAFAPMRHLLTQHAETISAEGHGTVTRVNESLNFAEKLLATNPLYARTNPQIAERVKRLRKENPRYLAHEYFNRDWHPMHFSSMAKWLSSAKLTFACSASYMDHVDVLNLTDEQQAFLREIPDPVFRETTRDFMVDQQFRRDYWVKGPRKLSPLAQAEALRAQRVILVTKRSDVSLKVKGSRGEATLTEAIYAPILDALADHAPRSLGQVEQAVQHRGLKFRQILEAVMVLISSGNVAAVQDDGVISAASGRVSALNGHLINEARGGGEVTQLASAVIGGGVPVGRFAQLFVQATSQGLKHPADLAQFVWKILQSQAQKIVRDGRPLESDAENLAELTAQATTFLDSQLPVLKGLQVV